MKKLVTTFLLPLLLLSCKEQSQYNADFTSTTADTTIQTVKHPVKTDLQRKKEADDLREIYSKPSSQWPEPEIDVQNGGTFKEIGSLPPATFPSDNQFSVQRAELGKNLFFDARLSGSKKLSCFSCHNPKLAWTDGKETAIGHEGMVLKRNSPPVVNSVYNTSFFWDGRAKSLEEQAKGVMNNPNEFHSTPESIAETVNSVSSYKTKFKEAYGIDKATIDDVAKAIATYERTVVTKSQSPFDKFISGQKTAMSDSAIRGMHLFRTTGRCINCHNGANFSDNKFHNLSLTYEGSDKEDLGLYNITKNPDDWGKFKTPSLRNISTTGPYMHNGVFLTVTKVLSLYNDGMHGKDPHKSPIIRPIGFSDQELLDLEEFLNALSEPVPQK